MNSLLSQEKILFRKRFLYLHLLVGNERSWSGGVWVQAGHSGQETDKLVYIYALLQDHRVPSEQSKLFANGGRAGKFLEFLFFFVSEHVRIFSSVS